MIATVRTKKVVGASIGIVILNSLCEELAPSTIEASITSLLID